MKNRELFVRDPVETTIPNGGVATLGEPDSPQEWEVLRYELESFVCEGEYYSGLDRVLASFLRNLSQATQPTVWVSGFYGSGKSHLVRVLEFLWRDPEFPSGASARGIATLPDEIRDHLRELDTAGRRRGGLWSAAGSLAGAGDSIELAILRIMLRSAGLPPQYAQGRFALWLLQNGLYEQVKAGVEDAGKSFDLELQNLHVARGIPRSLLAADPDFAPNEAEARTLIAGQFPNRQEISEDELLETMEQVLALQSGDGEELPCTLLVLDELQQYIGESSERGTRVQSVVEACSTRFGSRLLFVATGQSALRGTPLLAKLQDRFRVNVQLRDTDVEDVVRQVVLRKAPAKTAHVRQVIGENRGEIDRQLGGTSIASKREDDEFLVPDYPLLPARRRFWEKVLRATDRAGSSAQLRAQLRIVHDANRQVAERPLGTVIPGSALYDQDFANDLINTGLLLREVEEKIRVQRDGSEEGELRHRLCALIFLIAQIPTEAGADTGLRATPDALADLLVEDLTSGSAALRGRIPGLLEGLVQDGTLMRVGEEYHLQTREGAEWTGAYQKAHLRILGDAARIAADRDQEMDKAVGEALKGLRFTQGESKAARSVETHFSSEPPSADTGSVPVWVRSEWSASDRDVRETARAAGSEDPVVHVFLPKRDAEEIKKALAEYHAANEILQSRPAPNTYEGQQARDAMDTRRRSARNSLDTALRRVLESARVLQGGGSEVAEGGLRDSVESAARASLERLYPQFKIGDHARWEAVVRRAREGAGDPLEAVGYEGEAEKHPACSKVLDLVGVAGKKGSEARRHFKTPPYGWTQDTVDGSLLALFAAGTLRATDNGAPVTTAKELDQSRIGVAEFRAEKAPPLTASQRVEVRGLFRNAGFDRRSGEEVTAAHEFLTAMLDLAADAGGEAPLPEPPDAGYARELRALGGNELLAAVYESHERLQEDLTAWTDAKEKARDRHGRWQRLNRLLDHAKSLDGADSLREQAEAISRNRSLLEDPDPVPPLLNEAADLLRTAVKEAHRRYTEAFDARASWRATMAGGRSMRRSVNGS